MDARSDVEIQLDHLFKTNFSNENQCIATLETLKSVKLTQCKKIELLTRHQQEFSLGTSAIKLHGVEAWESLLELLHDIVDKLPDEINNNIIETIQLQDLYNIVRENGKQLHFCPKHMIRIQHITLMRKLLKLENQPEKVMDLLYFDGIIFSSLLFSVIKSNSIDKNKLDLSIEYLILLKELKDNNADIELLYKQLNPVKSGWSFLQFIFDSEHPLLAFHLINLGLFNKQTCSLFKFMKEKIFDYIKRCPDDVAKSMLSIILDEKGPFYDLLRTKQGFFLPSPKEGTWKKFVDLYRDLRGLPKPHNNDEEMVSLNETILVMK